MVRLWLNIITPDNFDEVKAKVRAFLFGYRKAKDEPGFTKQKKDQLLDERKLVMIAEAIYRKARDVSQYANVYAKLCAEIFQLELGIKGLAPSRGNAKQSAFRGKLISY